MAVNQGVNIRLIWQINGLDWAENSLWYIDVASRPYDQSDADEYAAGFAAAYTAAGLANDYTPEVRLDRLVLRDVHSDDNPAFSSVIGSVGTRGGEMLPRQSACVTTIRSTLPGRRGRGRIYWPAPAAGIMGTVGLFDAAEVADFTVFTQDIQAIDRAGFDAATLGVFSRMDNVIRAVVGVTTDTHVDVQTRRRDLGI